MTGSEKKIVEYVEGADKRFIIPVYQRNYDWKIENCKQLYDDLVRVITKNRPNHFFGSIVSVVRDGLFNEYLVIDGQQRLTTLSLLALAMYKLMKNGTLESASIDPDKVWETILIDRYRYNKDRDNSCKLKPVENDRKAYKLLLFGDESEYIPDSNMTINFKYFYDRIQKKEITVGQLYEAISKLMIINITLKQEDDPQLIFESLNSTGLALSEGDKIRNFILMGLPSEQQERFYSSYWNPIEHCTYYDVSSFVRDFLSVKQLSIPSMAKVYFTFKAYVEGTDIENFLQELLRYAKWYKILLKGTGKQNALDNCIFRLNLLETTVTRPFFLEVLRLQSEGKLSLAEVTDVFHYTENYLFRRSICSVPTNSLNKTFLMLHHEIMRYDGTEDNYVPKFKYALLSKTDVRRFPDDTEFTEALSARQVYKKMKGKNKIYLLERLENNNTVEDKNIYRHFEQGKCSIEHIMPQQLTQAWIKELGDDYEQIHERWLHRLANLTLTGYNSKYSNSTFADKRDMEHGFKQSGLRLNTWIGEQKHWGLSELEQRNQMLMQTALKTWPLPGTDYKPSEKQLDSCTLEDDIELKGRTIIRFAYMNIEQPVSTWIDMMEAVLKILHEDDKSVLFKLAYNQDASNELSVYVSNKPHNLRTALKIDENIYVEQNTSTATKISMLRKFFKAYGADTEDLVFYLK